MSETAGGETAGTQLLRRPWAWPVPAIALLVYVLMQPAAWQPATLAVKYSYRLGLPAHGLILMLVIAASAYLLLCVPAVAELVAAAMRAGPTESALAVWLMRCGLLALLYLSAFGALSRFG